jgi:hypothetical protein
MPESDSGGGTAARSDAEPITLTEAFVLIRGHNVAYRRDTGSPNCHRIAIGSLGFRGGTSRP